MPNNHSKGVYLYNGAVGVIGIIAALIILSLLSGIYTGIITTLFPPEDFQHLTWTGDPTLIAIQHGVVFRWWISVPLLALYLFIATTGGAYLTEAASLAIDDHLSVHGSTAGGGLLGPTAYAAIAIARFSSLYMVVALLLIAILPYGSGFATFLMIISVFAAVFGLLIPLPFIVLNWRFVMAAIGMTKGKIEAGKFIKERDQIRRARMSETGTALTSYQTNAETAAADEDRTAMSDEPKLPKTVTVTPNKRAIIPDQNEPTLPSNNPVGSVLNRFTTRQQRKEIEANTELKKAQADNITADSGIMDAHTERLRSYGQMKDAKTITETDATYREISKLEAEERLRELKARAHPPASEPSPPPPPAAEDSTGSSSHFDQSELSSLFAPSPAQEVRNAAEREIMKMLDGMPEENATEEFKRRFAGIRAHAERIINDGNLK